MDQYLLNGKTILITGASSGIGQGIAIGCSEIGASVIVTGRNSVKLDYTLSQLSDGNKTAIIADLTKKEDRESLVDKLPKLDGVVFNAGIGDRTLCKNVHEEDVDRVMSVNFTSVVLLVAELLRAKKINKNASIVFTASIAYKSPTIANAIYSASKGAIVAYAKCLSMELAPRLIRVNCICPAMVWTDLITVGGISKEQLIEDEKTYPLKRYGQPQDISNLATFLLSDASSWMTGGCIDITGGGRLN